MALFADLKRKRFLARLQKDERPPKPVDRGQVPPNLRSAHKITILFDADTPAHRKAVRKWQSANEAGQRKISLVGYFSEPTGGVQFEFLALDAAGKNWYGIPGGENVNRYLSEACDLLLRLGPTEHPELDYLAAAKQARLKVGPIQPTSPISIYQLQFDGQSITEPLEQLSAIEAIFIFTNATPT